MIESLIRRFAVSEPVALAARRAWVQVRELEYPAQHDVQLNILAAFREANIAQSDLAASSGYGYDDRARSAYEALLAGLFGSSAALARLSFVSGTHAIVTALAACTNPGSRILSASGRPYDTLRNAIAEHPQALVTRGIGYREIALREDGSVDEHALTQELARGDIGSVFIQRSRGYAPRPSLSIVQIERAIACIRAAVKSTPVLVDNCYGELVETREPTHVGADLAMGSLIKNLGGSLAPGGGYVIGRADLIERVGAYHYAPGLGTALGATFGFGRAFLQGLFLAPLIVEQTLRGLDFAAALFSELGYGVDPSAGTVRTDIVQAIRLGSSARLLAFARGLQRAMPLDARFMPEPGAVPGYVDPVVMSSGAFVQGATIELSCDAPLREPWEVYLQGGTVAEHGYLGALLAAEAVVAEG